MLSSARKKILKDMGIDFWIQRADPVAPAADKAPAAKKKPAAKKEPAADSIAATREVLDGVTDQALQQPRHVPPTRLTDESPSTRNTERTDPAVPAIVSVALPGVVVLLEALTSRRDARLARDIVTAAAGSWSQPPVERRFSLPLDAGNAVDSNQASALDRALRAFVDKDLQDHQARVVLYVGPVAKRLPDSWPDVRVIRVPDLAGLSRDPKAKQVLWAELCVLNG